MTLILSGADGLSDVDGSAATPAIRGTDANTGIFFGTDIIGFSEGGVEAARFNASGVFTTTNDATIQGLTVGRGGGAVATNTAVGTSALASNSTAASTTAIGSRAAFAHTSGNITAVGANALQSNTTGDGSVALGTALQANTTGSDNTGIGQASLYYNTTGASNTALGRYSLFNNTTASRNTAVGYSSLTANTTGTRSVGVGAYSLNVATTGNYNVAVGDVALENLTTGSYNTAIGLGSGAILTTGQYNTYLGANSNASSASVSNEIVISASNGTTGKGANTGFINPGGGGNYQGNNSSSWSTTSDQRLKKNIVDNGTGLSAIAAIRVRNFEYRLPEEVTDLPQNQAIAKTGVQLGVIAQELQAVLPDCVKTESTGVMTVDSDNLTWYLVNAVKELTARVKQLEGN